MKKSLGLLGIFLMSFVSAYSGFYGISPSDFLENEWFVFGGVFLIVFAIVYLALSRNFTSKKKNKMFPWMEEVEDNKMIPGVIALIIALFTASAFVRQGLASGASSWILTFAGLVFFVLLMSVLANKFGGVVITSIFLALWFILTFNDPYEILPFQIYDFIRVYEAFTSVWVFLILVAMLVYFLFRGKKQKK